jgi:hypothetical protein
MISLAPMSRATRAALSLVLSLAVGACGGGRLGRQYEYEEQIYLDLDGSADIIVNASVAALVALHGLDLPVDPRARLDRREIREAYDSAAARVTRVSRPWRRDGRRFVQIRLAVDDVRRLAAHGPFSRAGYALELREEPDALLYRQTLGAPADNLEGAAPWTGDELFAVKLHLPSRVQFHNARDIDLDEPRDVERGNIVTWEQRLADRRAGVPLDIEARIDTASILSWTLSVFGAALVAAIVALGGAVWWIRRKDEG